jgi:cardiolipin synthase
MMAAGARVFLYKKSWLHAKLMVVDDVVATVGSFNMDVRSFHLNFEVGAFLYDAEAVASVARTITALERESELLDRQAFANRSRAGQFVEGMCRLFSPVL